MKQFDSTSSDDLDAGWDVNDTPSPAISVRQPTSPVPASVSVEPLDEEIDAGWDSELIEVPAPTSTAPEPAIIDDARQHRHSEIQVRGRPSSNAQPATQKPPAPSGPPAHQLTKKERRRIEREQRIHAAKKQAEARAGKRSQRKHAPEASPSRPAPASVAPPLASTPSPKKRRRKAKPRRETSPPAGPASRVAARASSETTRLQNSADPPQLVAQEQSAAARSSSTGRAPRFAYVSIGLLVLLALGMLYSLFARR